MKINRSSLANLIVDYDYTLHKEFYTKNLDLVIMPKSSCTIRSFLYYKYNASGFVHRIESRNDIEYLNFIIFLLRNYEN